MANRATKPASLALVPAAPSSVPAVAEIIGGRRDTPAKMLAREILAQLARLDILHREVDALHHIAKAEMKASHPDLGRGGVWCMTLQFLGGDLPEYGIHPRIDPALNMAVRDAMAGVLRRDRDYEIAEVEVYRRTGYRRALDRLAALREAIKRDLHSLMNLAPRDGSDLDVKAAIVLRLTEGEDFTTEAIKLVRSIRDDAKRTTSGRGSTP